MSEELNYEKEMSIDINALDDEWLGQPLLMMKYARHYAEAQKKLDNAKEALDLVTAELDKQIRTNPSAYGIEKITDKVVENTLPLQNSYKKAKENLTNAKFNFSILQGAVKAVDGRKDALENLVKLFGQQYFAGPSVPKNKGMVEQVPKMTRK